MRSRDVCVWVCLVAGVPAIVSGQGRQGGNTRDALEVEKAYRALAAQRLTTTSDVINAPLVTEAPFSAEATTTVTQVLGDGTRIEQTTTARFFRDRAGRVRREQTIAGLGALNGRGNAETITIDPDPGDGTAYTLDPMTRTARRAPRIAFTSVSSVTTGPAIRINSGAVMLNGSPVAAQPVWRANVEQLGTRQFDGVKAVGRKTTSVIPIGDIGNDRPIEITDERWESQELRMLVYSRTSDPRTGVVEYRLTNINRSEPPADLFTIPADYTVVEPGEPGARGAGGRGAPRPVTPRVP